MNKNQLPVTKTVKEIQDQFDAYLNRTLKRRAWRKSLADLRVVVASTDIHGTQGENFLFIVISLVGRIESNHSRIEIFIEGDKIVHFPIFDFTQEAWDFKKQFSTPFIKDLLRMLNHFYNEKTGVNIGYFETLIRGGSKSILFLENFFESNGVSEECITLSEIVINEQTAMSFRADLSKGSFWYHLK
jgi:hypothetical protein